MAKKATKTVAVVNKIRGVDLADDHVFITDTPNQVKKRAWRITVSQQLQPEISASRVTEKPVTLDDRISNKVIQLA